jgi:hypothetical protein
LDGVVSDGDEVAVSAWPVLECRRGVGARFGQSAYDVITPGCGVSVDAVDAVGAQGREQTAAPVERSRRVTRIGAPVRRCLVIKDGEQVIE